MFHSVEIDRKRWFC